MKERRRINISLDPETYEDIVLMSRDYGFHSAAEMAAVLLRVLVRHVREREAGVEEEDESDEAYVGRMFVEYADWEPRPDPEYVPRIHRTKRNG